jgi:hypothetical protein
MSANMDKTLHPHERVALQRRRVLWILAGLGGFCIVGALLGFWLWNWRQSHRVAVFLEAAAARGEPITGDELNAYFRVPDSDEDASALWIAGLRPLTETGYHQTAEGTPFVGDHRDANGFGGTFTGFQRLRAKAHLQKYADSLDCFHAAAAKGGRARLPIDFRAGVGTLLPFTQATRDALRLLLLDIDQKVREGDERGCAKSLLTVLFLSRCLEHEPCAISQNVCSVIECQGDDALAALLGSVSFTPEELSAFEKVIASRKVNERMHRGLVGERVMGISAFQSPEDLRMLGKKSYIPVTSADLALYLEHIEQLVAAAELEFPECIAAAQKAQDRLDKKSSQGISFLTSELTKTLTPDFKKNFVVHMGYAAAKNRVALAAIAVERYRRNHDAPPKTIKDLVPEYLKAEPIDPFTGKAMIYRVTPEVIVIYSVGENLADDAGEDLSGNDRGVLIPRK